jgi:hypothetical protein
VKLYFIPKTRLGKWSISFIIAFIVFLVIHLILAASPLPETSSANPYLIVPILLAAISGVLAFFLGLIAIIKSKERAFLVFISTILGFFVVWFVVASMVIGD